MTKWRPILSPSDGITQKAIEAIEAISEAILSENYIHESQYDYRYQSYEAALLFSYLAIAKKNDGWAGRAASRLNAAIDYSTQHSKSLALFGGLAGLGWTVEHVSQLLANDLNPESESVDSESTEEIEEDLISDIDNAILEDLKSHPSVRCYDLVSGLVGFGIYFLERWPRQKAVEGIIAVFDQLDSLAERTDVGVSWFSDPALLPAWQRQKCPDGYYNLGVAHGVPGIIYFLSTVSTLGLVEPRRVDRLLHGCVDWLLTQRDKTGRRARFSPWIAPGLEASASRLGWCYGDLGIVSVLLQVAQRAERTDWVNFANELLDNCMAWPVDEAQAEDAPLCHGSAGIAHIFNRIYQTSGDLRCKDSAILWFDRTLSMCKPGTGVGGFSALTRPDFAGPIVWESSPAFLDGASGIALALLASTTSIDPGWDRLLLLSSRS